MLMKDIKEMDEAKEKKLEVMKKESKNDIEAPQLKEGSCLTLTDRLKNTEIFQQTLISRCRTDSQNNKI